MVSPKLILIYIFFLLCIGCKVTPSQLVCEEKYEELVKLLDSYPEAVNHQDDNDGSTALHDACRLKLVKFVKLLLEKGADPNIKTTAGNFEHTPMHLAIRHTKETQEDSIKIVEMLLKKGADINSVDSYGRTPLAMSLRSNIDFTFFLLENGADLLQKDVYGNSALTILCRLDDTPEVFFKYLRDNNFKINFELAKNEISILNSISADKSDRTINYLIKYGYGEVVLRRAIMDNNIAVIRYLLSKNVEIPKDYSPKRIIKRPDTNRRRSIFRYPKNWDDELYCTEEVHEIIKAHLDKGP